MEQNEILHPEKRYEKAPSEELITSVTLEGKRKLLTNDDRDVILNLAELFNTERQDSKNYKLYGKIKMVFRNMYTGFTFYEHLEKQLYLIGDGSDSNWNGYIPYDEFAFLRQDSIRETVAIPQTFDLAQFTGFSVTVTGTTGCTQHNTITPMTAPYFNWNIYMSYVYAQDENFLMNYTLSGSSQPHISFVSGDGIPFRISDNGGSYKLTSPIEHGMNQGEYIILENYPYYLNSVGDENYNSDKYVINIMKSQVPSGITTFSNLLITGKRCLDKDNEVKTTSQYYVHKHKTIRGINDYILDKSGFESPIWRDEKKILFENIAGDNDVLVQRNRMESVLYDITEPFILTGLTNNLGYLPTELYVSVILRNGNGYFDYPPKVGYKFNFHNTWIDVHFDGETSLETSLSGTTFVRTSGYPPTGYTFISGDTLPVGSTLTGAFIEYNPKEMKERIISETFHKFYIPSHPPEPGIFDYGQIEPSPFFSGGTVTNPFGFFYQPHYRIKLRELSPYVETSDALSIENLPQNAKYYTDEGLWKWRDLYDHGYIDDLGNGTDYPFINNIHYIKTDINFYLRNEQLYTHKTDGVYDFNTRNNGQDKINC